MRRVELHDGEGVDQVDDMMIGQLAERSAYRPTRAEIQTAVDDAGADSPLLVRGADPTHSGTGTRTITLTHGVWCAAEDNPPAAAGDSPEVYFGDSTGAAYVLDANTNGSVYRRDILQAKIDAETTTAPESRDFEDSATRALTTQVFDKRRVRTATISVKKGVDQVSEALADANEPAPDAGYVKIFSFLIDNTGACAAAKRKRYTVGCRRRKRIIPAAVATHVDGPPTVNESTYSLTVGSADDKAWVGLDVAAGRRLRRVQAVTDSGLASQLRVKLVRHVFGTGATTIATVLSTLSGGTETIDSGTIDELIGSVAGANYFIELDMAVAGDASDFSTITVTED